MALRCPKFFRIVVKPPADMPLDQAIYVSSANAIYGVRGGFIHKYTSSGTFVSKRRWAPHNGTWGSIVYEPVNNEIWVTCWNDPFVSAYATNPEWSQALSKCIYRLNVTTLAQIGIINLVGAAPTPQYRWYEYWSGIKCLAYSNASGTQCIYALLAEGIGATSYQLLKINPSTYPLGWADAAATIQHAVPYTDIVEYNNEIWYAENAQSPADSYLHNCNPITCAQLWGSLTIPAGFPPLGFCYASGSFWCGTRDRFLRRVPVDGSPTSAIDIGVPSSITSRVRYDSTLGLVFVANSTSDSVSWFSPAAPGTVYWQTGYDYPIDIVTTGTKAFAVQGGSVGLLEIDTTAPTGHT